MFLLKVKIRHIQSFRARNNKNIDRDLQPVYAFRLRSLPLFYAETSGRCYRENKAFSLRTASFSFKLQSFAINLSRTFCLKIIFLRFIYMIFQSVEVKSGYIQDFRAQFETNLLGKPLKPAQNPHGCGF